MDEQDICKRAAALAARYARMVPGIVVEDARGAALVGQLEAAQRYDPERGAWPALAHTAAVRAIRDELRLRLPASGPRRAGAAAQQPFLSQRAYLFDESTAASEDDAQRVLWRNRVRARVYALLGEEGAWFALGVLGDELRPAEFAQAAGATVCDVYAASKRVTRRLIADEQLRKLWEEQP